VSSKQSADAAPSDAWHLLAKLPPLNTWADGSLIKLCQNGNRTDYKDGDALQLNGTRSNSVYLLEAGVFELVVTIANGREQAFGYLHAGAILGLNQCFAALSADEALEYVAIGDATVWRVPSAVFRDVMWADVAMADSVLTILTTRNSTLIDTLANTSLLGAHGRVARSLLQAYGEPDFNLVWSRRLPQIESMTQAQLARMLGLSRQSVGSILREFANAGLIRIAREKIEVISHDGLHSVVTGKP
jgi:CRP/FNR family transcriptional regulator, cyclic AMP receptor protein